MRIGRYEVIDEIGAGGMGRVRLARDPVGKLVVLKTCLRNDVDDDERLRDEARVGLRISHPSLVETVELFEHDDGKAGRERPVLVTAYVPGVSLLELRRVGRADPVVVCRLGRQLAEALDAIHDARDLAGQPLNVLHRDVTAANCLVGHDGRARLIDLGISRSTESRALRTETGLLRGTLRYLAPELFDGGQYSAQSDLWALGVVLWEALIGRAAVSGSDAVAVGRICSGNLMMLDEGEQPDPRVSRAIAQLLKKNPQERPRRAREAAALFAMLEKALPVAAGDDAETLSQALVWRAIGGPVEGAPASQLTTAAHVERASRAFADNDLMTPTGPVRAAPSALPSTVADQAPQGTDALPSDAFQARKTPSNAISDYAASLQNMEKALAEAWERANAADRATLANLPVITGKAIERAADAAPPLDEFPLARSSPSPSSPPSPGRPNVDDLLAPFLLEATDDDGPQALAEGFGFPPAFPLPPQTPHMIIGDDGPTPATPAIPPRSGLLSSPVTTPLRQDHDESSTPGLPGQTPGAPAIRVAAANLRARTESPTRSAAVLGLMLLLTLAVAITLVELGVWTPAM